MIVSPDGSKAYVANDDDGTISVINTITNQVTATIPVGTYALYVTISPDGSKLYVTDYMNNVFYAVDATTYAILATLKIPEAFGLAVSPDGSKIYAGSYNTYDVYVIDAKIFSVITTINVERYPQSLVISPDGKWMYTANSQADDVSIVNLLTNTVVASIPVRINPQTISLTSDGTMLYVPNAGSNAVSAISLATNQIIASVPATEPLSFGNFITPIKICNSPTVKFTITVNPQSTLSSAVSVSPVTVNISACFGTASSSPNIEQFIASGTNLIGDITLTASARFEYHFYPQAEMQLFCCYLL